MLRLASSRSGSKYTDILSKVKVQGKNPPVAEAETHAENVAASQRITPYSAITSRASGNLASTFQAVS
jgi:hypothetical protein